LKVVNTLYRWGDGDLSGKMFLGLVNETKFKKRRLFVHPSAGDWLWQRLWRFLSAK
jgi:hypothetical protein